MDANKGKINSIFAQVNISKKRVKFYKKGFFFPFVSFSICFWVLCNDSYNDDFRYPV